MANRCRWMFSILWFFLVVLIAVPVALICALLWVFVSPFSACCNGCVDVMNFLHKGMQLLLDWAQNMVDGRSCGSS